MKHWIKPSYQLHRGLPEVRSYFVFKNWIKLSHYTIMEWFYHFKEFLEVKLSYFVEHNTLYPYPLGQKVVGRKFIAS